MEGTAEDPCDKVSARLRLHVHLVSSFKCESQGDPFNLSDEQVVQLLKTAAIDTKSNNESWCWKWLDSPRDRTAFITWQSPKQLAGRHFPSDGYIWVDPEALHVREVSGSILERHEHLSGYHPVRDKYTFHARTRYRLAVADPGRTSRDCDPNLWLVLYKRSDGSKTIPIDFIGPKMLQRQTPMLEQRRMIMQKGFPQTKDFIWKDSEHWPEIQLPPSSTIHHVSGPNMIARGQQASFVAGQQLIDLNGAQPPLKRPKPVGPVHANALPDGEDDGGNGDLMDVLTPRDISRARYKQHAEWMEEVYASPYTISQIRPVSIGLGRKGEFTRLSVNVDSIDTPTEFTKGATATKRVTAADFTTYVHNAEEKLADLRVEIEQEKTRQARRLAKVHGTSLLREAEIRLRGTAQPTSSNTNSSGTLVSDRDMTDPGSSHQDADTASARHIDDVGKIVKAVETSFNRRVTVIAAPSLITKGGLEERSEIPQAVKTTSREGTNIAQEVKPSVIQQHVSSNGDHEAVDPPQSHAELNETPDDTQTSSAADDDYVMVDKDQPPSQSSPRDEVGDDPHPRVGGMGDDFLNFEPDTNHGNFDSMFSDTIATSTELEGQDDGVIDDLDSNMLDTGAHAIQNAIDTLSSGQPES